MASHARRPLEECPAVPERPTEPSPLKLQSQRSTSGVKRPRSPNARQEPIYAQNPSKKPRPSLETADAVIKDEEALNDKEKRRADRDAAKELFRAKYTNAFPRFRFYFDLDADDSATKGIKLALQKGVKELGATYDDFFSSQITHLITNKPIKAADFDAPNKENASKLLSGAKSPRSRRPADDQPVFDIVQKALTFDRKVWSVEKLQDILKRLLAPPATGGASLSTSQSTSTAQTTSNLQRSLTRLLETERIHGTTERDPTQKRRDFRYFNRGNYFVLVEDMRQELATIHAHEYQVTKRNDGSLKGNWPILHCHPCARGPFIEFNDKERRIYERSLLKQEKPQEEIEYEIFKREEKSIRRKSLAGVSGDLRRSASMNNMRKIAQNEAWEAVDSITDTSASTGGYVAASGNSVSITSNAGTTSSVSTLNKTLPPSLRAHEKYSVVTSRKASVGPSEMSNKPSMLQAMGPPHELPALRKTKSTNSVRLPKREEGSKPGYCECCRCKFDDFQLHKISRVHRKFAANDANFEALDFVLASVRRQTIEEAMDEEARWRTNALQHLKAEFEPPACENEPTAIKVE